ncbi:HrpT family type III secretion system protein [Vibrio quintilis]|uniref:Type III secretion protein HrpT n=1 Tax=Vibrio quintilis TaxID=1117707 RepID=A0A1M7YSP8_9VIBR|nr:hypothetical protein VQ7734_01386 [Vibrio quintilis]
MRLCLTGIFFLLLGGCATHSDARCNTAQCTRPLSSPQTMVIWWGPEMRQGLPKDTAVTSDAFIPE